MLSSYQTDWATVFITFGNLASSWVNVRQAGVDDSRRIKENKMMTLKKTFFAATMLATMASPAFAQVPSEFNPGMAIMFNGGKMMQMPIASGPKNHQAMMKRARKVPSNTVFFMEGGQMYMVSGTLDPTGNFYRP